jgi:tartrate-resistant acid phosphatase type 5
MVVFKTMKSTLFSNKIKTLTLIGWLAIICLGAAACDPLTDLPTSPPLAGTAQNTVAPLSNTSPSQETPVLPPRPTDTPIPTDTAAPTATAAPQAVRFAVIGDFGEDNSGEKDVSEMVKSWQPDFVITTGDNNYPNGAAETIDQRIGQYYHEFIYPYHGAFGQGADQLRFFPSLGNHDWLTANAQPYLDYFELPGNERYYDFVWGDIHFFALDADSREPDGVSQVSPQANWLHERLAGSTSPWKVVYFHQAPYSSGYHGSTDWMRWPFAEWGASVVFSGHDHTYERLIEDGIPYFVDGLGGGPIYWFTGQIAGSQVQYNQDYGAMLVVSDSTQMTFQFINRKGKVIDTYQITQP